jgi:hypothetical protein
VSFAVIPVFSAKEARADAVNLKAASQISGEILMNKYRVFYSFRKGSSSTSSTIDVEAESDFMAAKIAEGQARKRNSGRDSYEFLVTKIELR